MRWINFFSIWSSFALSGFPWKEYNNLYFNLDCLYKWKTLGWDLQGWIISLITKRGGSDYENKSLLKAFLQLPPCQVFNAKNRISLYSSIAWLPQQGEKGLIGNWIENIMPHFLDICEFKPPIKSKSKALIGFLGLSMFRCKDQIEKFQNPMVLYTTGNSIKTSMTETMFFYRENWSWTGR